MAPALPVFAVVRHSGKPAPTGYVSSPKNEGQRPQGPREMAYQPQEIFFRSSAPVTIDEDKCIAEKGCTVCVEVCPMDLLAINPTTQKAYMAFDECWYCMPCEKDCPTGAVKVDIPYLLR
jgi:NAD-dependent dihydropyrimidine dehydrogenase PreA subunit